MPAGALAETGRSGDCGEGLIAPALFNAWQSASADPERTARNLRLYSPGNFLFDQADAANTGCLLEVRFFVQGSWAVCRR